MTPPRSPAQLAKDEGLRPAKVRRWIKNEELAAVNLAESSTGRPRWRITDEAWQAFLARRAVRPKRDRRRRAQRITDVVEFFK